jgi:hypothetical protein
MPHTKPNTGNLKSPKSKPVLPHIPLGVWVAPTKNSGSDLSSAAGPPNSDDFQGVQTSSVTDPNPLKLPNKVEELTPPPFTSPNNQSPDDSHIRKRGGRYKSQLGIFCLATDRERRRRRSAHSLSTQFLCLRFFHKHLIPYISH